MNYSEIKEKMECIKKFINDSIKIVDITFSGIDSDKKLINISDILRNHSEKQGLPAIEKYKFFNFEHNKDKILDNIKSIEKSYEEFEDLLESMRKKRVDIKTKHICGTFHKHQVIYKDELTYLLKTKKEIELEKKKINRKNLEKAVKECKRNFNKIIKAELVRHDLKNKDIQADIEKKFNFVKDIDTYINKINMDWNIVLDISDEILSNVALKNELKNANLTTEIREKIDEYYSLSCKLNKK